MGGRVGPGIKKEVSDILFCDFANFLGMVLEREAWAELGLEHIGEVKFELVSFSSLCVRPKCRPCRVTSVAWQGWAWDN